MLRVGFPLCVSGVALICSTFRSSAWSLLFSRPRSSASLQLLTENGRVEKSVIIQGNVQTATTAELSDQETTDAVVQKRKLYRSLPKQTKSLIASVDYAKPFNVVDIAGIPIYISPQTDIPLIDGVEQRHTAKELEGTSLHASIPRYARNSYIVVKDSSLLPNSSVIAFGDAEMVQGTLTLRASVLSLDSQRRTGIRLLPKRLWFGAAFTAAGLLLCVYPTK